MDIFWQEYPDNKRPLLEAAWEVARTVAAVDKQLLSSRAVEAFAELAELAGRAQGQARYFFDQDGSCHWYLVPLSKRVEWDEWCGLDENDERSWEAPEWAKRLPGHPSWVPFADPRERRDD